MAKVIPIFPAVVDNSMRKELIKCEKAAHYRYELGLSDPASAKVDLVAGKAFASGLEAMRKAFYVDGLKRGKAVEKGILAVNAKYGNFTPDKASPKTMQRMAGALAYYEGEYPLDQEKINPVKLLDGTLAIEVQFQEFLPIVHPETGSPLIYAGRFDELGLDENGDAWVVDEKTTSQMGEKWANQWPLDSQMTGYCWGARKLLDINGMSTTKVAGAIINGIAIRKYDYEAKRFPVFREQWEIDRWYDQMIRDMQQWKRRFTGQDHSWNLDHACAYYLNPCQFVPLCKSKNPERLIESGSFVVERWDPVARD